MGVIWHKIWFDLWHNKTRTLLAVLSISAGVFAMGAIFGMSDMLGGTMDRSHQAVMPPHINIYLTTLTDYETLMNLKDLPGVEEVEPYNTITILYKLRAQDEWRQGIIHSRSNFETQKYELVQLREGHWPESKNEIGVERMAAQFNKVGIGDAVTIKLEDNVRTFPITSLIRHPFVPPPQFQDLSFFFMSSQALERFDIPDGKYGSLFVRVTPYSRDYAREVAASIKQKLARQNIGIGGTVYEDPERHWGRDMIDGFVLVQELLAVISVIMGAVLIYNTLTNIITQQTDQIGILKAIGSSKATVIRIYLLTALIYGGIALVIALPLGSVLAFGFSQYFLNLFNIDFNEFQFSNRALLYQVLAALLTPLLSGLVPVLQGASITVRQAIASYGLGGDFRTGRLDRLVDRVGQRWLPTFYATALGNMIRHRGRLLLTQFVLITAGSAYLMVMSLNSSLALTLDNLYAQRDYDALLQFYGNQRAGRVNALAETIEGVEKAELRLVQDASLFTSGQLAKSAGLGTNINGIPSYSDFFQPLIIAGRWFAEGEDGRVVVINRDTAQKNEINLGDIIRLDLGELGEDEWQVIGIYEPVFVGGFNSDTVYAPLEALYQATKKYNQGSILYVRTTSKDADFTSAVTKRLKDMFERHGLEISYSDTLANERKTNEWSFGLVTTMMLGLSYIVALVGGIALMGALSIGVIERTKEIGVLRAVGARSSAILGIFILEGTFQGLLSWMIAIPIAYFASPAVADALGKTMFGATLDYQFNTTAVFTWFVTSLIISILASILPARKATRISVRDSLAYA